MITSVGKRDTEVLPFSKKIPGIIYPEDTLPPLRNMLGGAQHVVAMFGATVLAPLLMGFDPNVCVLFSGLATILFFLFVGGAIPSYLGSSFAFISAVIAATGYSGSGANPNISIALGGIIVAGAIYFAVGAVVAIFGYRWLERLMPPEVTGAIVAIIGLKSREYRCRRLEGRCFEYNIWTRYSNYNRTVGRTWSRFFGSNPDFDWWWIILSALFFRMQHHVLGSSDRFLGCGWRGLDWSAAVLCAGVSRHGDYPHSADRHRIGGGEFRPCSRNRCDDGAQSRSLSWSGFYGGRPIHPSFRFCGRHRSHYLRGKHRCYEHNEKLFVFYGSRRGNICCLSRAIAKVRRGYKNDSDSHHRRLVIGFVRLDYGDGRPNLGRQ